MIYSDGFSYFYEMMFLFILPFSESLKWNKSFFLPFSPGFHQREIKCPSYSTRLSDLHSVEGCHSLEVSFTEIYTFLCSTSLVRFLSMFYLWPILFTLEWKTSTFRGVMPFFSFFFFLSFPLNGSRCFFVLSDGSYQPTPWYKSWMVPYYIRWSMWKIVSASKAK